MDKTKVYDLPTRAFHWLFAALFLSAFFIGKFADDESSVYAYHMLAGLALAGVVGLRIVWGFIGSRYARFSSFALRPNDLFQYFKDFFTSMPGRTLGHNPASSWAALVMMALALGLALTGYFMTSGGNKETLEDTHELLANAFIVVVIGHVAGVILHTLRHRDWIGLSMVSGKKLSIDGQAGITHSYRGVAGLFVSLVAVFAIHLGKNFDTGTQTLQLFGTSLQLGESEEHEKDRHNDEGEEHDEDDDHDEDED
jgi:cytochrome b